MLAICYVTFLDQKHMYDFCIENVLNVGYTFENSKLVQC